MKLSKAKEILELNVNEAGLSMPHDTLAAVKLSIEAITRLVHARKWSTRSIFELLPGETREG